MIEFGLYGLDDLDRKVADACNRIRLLDDHFQTNTRMVVEALGRGDKDACERVERECARSAQTILEALLELETTKAGSVIGIGLKASTLAHFLPRFHDEVAEEHLQLVAAFADEVLAHYAMNAVHDEANATSPWTASDPGRVLIASVVDYIAQREALLVSLATTAQGHASRSASEVPGEAEYLDSEDWFAVQLNRLACQDFRNIADLLALAGIVAALARQDPGSAISSFVITLGLKLSDTVLLQPAI